MLSLHTPRLQSSAYFFSSCSLLCHICFKPKSEVIECILRHYDNKTFVACLESGDPQHGFDAEGVRCIQEVLEFCFLEVGVTNDLLTRRSRSHGSAPAEVVLETFPSLSASECENSPLLPPLTLSPVPSYLLSSENHWTVASTSRAIWLGALAKEGHWRPLNDEDSSLIGTISRQLSQSLRSYVSISKRPECKLQCHLYSTSPFSFQEEIPQIPSLPTELSSYQTGFESSSCSPGIIIAGFAQSAVSIVYSLLLLHPQVLPVLGSSQIQEEPSHYKPSCYRTDINIRSEI
jgi:hypothetical protein